VLLAGVICTGCQTSDSQFAGSAGAAAPVGNGKAEAAAAQTNVSSDLINVGESLIFSFTDVNPAIQAFETHVNENGTITLMENQTFTAAGKTHVQLEKEVRERYVPKFFVKMTVTIAPKERVYFVRGEVRQSGQQFYRGPMTVLKAIATAGDFTDFAKKTKVKLLRLNGEKLTINCKKAITEPARYDLPVYPGDVIYVPRRILF